MAKTSPLILLFVVAAAMVNLSVHRAMEVGTWHEEAKGLVLGFSLAQLVLLILWLVFGGSNALARLFLVLVMAGFLADLNASVTSATGLDEWLGAIALFGFTVAVPLIILRVLGMGWVGEPGSIATEKAGLWACYRQFSLGTLFVWVTGSCVVLGVLRGIGFPWEDALQVIVHCVGFAVVGLLSLGAVFGGRHVAVRLPVLAVVSPTLGGLMGFPWAESLLVSVICAVELLGTAFGASVMRMSGLRLGWGTANSQ